MRLLKRAASAIIVVVAAVGVVDVGRLSLCEGGVVVVEVVKVEKLVGRGLGSVPLAFLGVVF